MTEQEIFERLEQTVAERWDLEAGIGTLNGPCCVLGCVSLVKGLPLQREKDKGIGHYYPVHDDRLSYPKKDDPVVLSLAATIPPEYVTGRFAEDRDQTPEYAKGVWDHDLTTIDKVTTYNDTDGRTKLEILEWVQRAKKHYDENQEA